MSLSRTTICIAFLLFVIAFSPGLRGEPTLAVRIDCANDSRALWEAEPVVQHRDGDELHQYWLLVDRPDLWALSVPVHEELARYREKFRQVVSDTGPLALIRANRERNVWLERDYPAERRINRQVEGGVGSHRPMTCLETQILAYQAARFPLYEQPSEIVALIARRSEESGDRIKVYIAADDDSIPPKPSHAVAALETEVARGWRLYGLFHNHTFIHSEDRGLLPVASPSASDVQVSVGLAGRLGLEYVLVSDGFSTLELTVDELKKLARAAAGPD